MPHGLILLHVSETLAVCGHKSIYPGQAELSEVGLQGLVLWYPRTSVRGSAEKSQVLSMQTRGYKFQAQHYAKKSLRGPRNALDRVPKASSFVCSAKRRSCGTQTNTMASLGRSSGHRRAIQDLLRRSSRTRTAREHQTRIGIVWIK